MKTLRFAGLGTLILLLSLLLFPAHKVGALGGSFESFPEIDQSVIGQLQNLSPGDIKIDIVNRNVFNVTFPTTRPFPSSAKTYNDLFGGTYVDSNSDEDLQYVRINGETGTLDAFDNGSGLVSSMSKPLHLGAADTSQLKSLEITVAFKVGKVPSQSFLVYLDNGFSWRRTGNTGAVNAFVELSSASTPEVIPTQIPNFNLIGSYNRDSKAITTFETSDARTFNSCPDRTLRTDCDKLDSDHMTTSLSEEQMANNDTTFEVRWADSSGKVISSGVLIAGGLNRASGVTPGAAAATEPSCESEGGSFSWLMCPALELVSGILNFIDSQLNSLLNLPDSYYKCQPDGSGCTVKNAWSRMRNLAYIILIPIMLVMVISTALGFKFVDAYTVKRAMPRLLAAVIFISLSLPIVTIMADIANGVGKGIMGLILGAVTGDNANNITLASLFDPGLGGDGLLAVGIGGGGLLVAGLAASTMAIGLIGVVLLFGLSAVASIIVLFFVMALRQMILVTLMILSPLAILSWIFPGNDKLWKIWKESFTKLLMLYPIVMLLIASGKAFAFIVDGVSESSFLNRILVLVAYIAPYFLIKGTFKLAGSTFGNLAGMVNDRSKGLFDRNKKIRSKLLGNSMKKGISAAQGGKFLRGKDTERLKKWNEKIQRAAHYNSILDTGIKDGLTRSGRKATIGAAIQATEKQHQKHILEDKLIDTWINYDDLGGMAGDVVFSNEEGIRRRFMMKGVGVRMVKKKDADGNDTGEDSDEVYFDSKGQMEVTNNDLLNSKVNDVMSKIKAGDRAGALRSGLITSKAFEKVGADGSTYTDTSELERNVAHVMKASREYGDEVLGQALVKKAVAGGTYYQNAADAWRAADLAVGHDGAARADMAASLRGIATNAGRIDQGGGSFGKTLGFMDQLHKINARLSQATTEEEKTAIREEFNNVQRQYMEHVIDNQPASNLYHPSMKENYVGRNITSVQRERLLDAAEKAQGKPEGSAEQEHLIRLMADADNTHNFAQQSKPSFARDVGDKLMDLKLPESDALKITIPAKVELQPTGILDASGKEIMREVVVQGAEERLAENVRAGVAYLKGSGNKTYQKYQRQWSSDDEAEARQSNAAFEAAAKAGANNKPGGGINNKPTGGLNT